MRRPQATTVSPARTKARRVARGDGAAFSAPCARHRRAGSSPLRGVSSISAGSIASGVDADLGEQIEPAR
jgi:hypothetical protein